ncbi:unnamed protein product [Hymenolepis diminuta]|uniref:Uncharacterized protein n=1 Tax=Hymenolepis diminuta TaxID=6216 RepID=A0A564YX08_HYMDI|nr:unnamed protein product [Hymenolepis diminuta]
MRFLTSESKVDDMTMRKLRMKCLPVNVVACLATSISRSLDELSDKIQELFGQPRVHTVEIQAPSFVNSKKPDVFKKLLGKLELPMPNTSSSRGSREIYIYIYICIFKCTRCLRYLEILIFWNLNWLDNNLCIFISKDLLQYNTIAIEMKRYALTVSIRAKYRDLEIAEFPKFATSFVYKVRKELNENSGNKLSTMRKRKKHCKPSADSFTQNT